MGALPLIWIGGGFGAGIHNTLEPISHAVPVIFGPKYQKFQEAVTLVKTKGGFVVNNTTDFEQHFQNLQDLTMLQLSGKKAHDYIAQNSGSTQLIIEKISTYA